MGTTEAAEPSSADETDQADKATGNGHFTGVTAWLTYLANGLDYGWKRSRPSRPVPVQVGP
jgi:hypothetical protein